MWLAVKTREVFSPGDVLMVRSLTAWPDSSVFIKPEVGGDGKAAVHLEAFCLPVPPNIPPIVSRASCTSKYLQRRPYN